MKKYFIALAAALALVFSVTGCNEIGGQNSGSSESSGNSTSGSSSTSEASTSSKPGSSSSDEITTSPQTVRCGDIVEDENGVKTFDTEITCGNAFVVGYHYIKGENGHIENAIPTIRPLGITDFDKILKDPLVGGDGSNGLLKSDFNLVNGVYRMNEEKAKTLLGSLTKTYSFNEYWKNQKMAELVSTEKISAEEARPKVEELFENMGKNSV